MKQKIHAALLDLLEHHESRAGKIFGHVLITVIILSTLSFAFENTEFLKNYRHFFLVFDQFVIGFFLVEYVLRLIIAPRPLKFVFSPLGLVDLLVVISGLSHLNLVFLRGLRLLRILQLVKVIRYSDFLLNFLRSFSHYRHEFNILGTTFIVVWIMSGLGAFLIEHNVNEKINSLGDALWWAIVTMATVGYGDITPVSVSGKLLAALVIVLGVSTMSMLTAIVTRIFLDHFFGKRLHTCTFCHFPHHDHDARFCKNCGNPLDARKLDSAATIAPHHIRMLHKEGEKKD